MNFVKLNMQNDFLRSFLPSKKEEERGGADKGTRITQKQAEESLAVSYIFQSCLCNSRILCSTLSFDFAHFLSCAFKI